MPRGHGRFQAVALGASLGGLDLSCRLLAALPAGFVPALLLVLHRGEADHGALAHQLRRHCALPVLEPCAGDPLRGGEVLLAPAGYHLLVESRTALALSVDAPVCAARPSVDVLFESAAQAFGPELLAIVLSGLGRDGGAGLATVRAHGGHCIVQDPTEAEAAAMPSHALSQVPNAQVLRSAQIAQLLQGLAWRRPAPTTSRQDD